MAGAEVARLYISYSTTSPKSRFSRPVRSLTGFEKVFLQPGEKKSVSIPIDRYSTAVWDEKKNSWCCERGRYTASIVAGGAILDGSFEIEKETFWNGL